MSHDLMSVLALLGLISRSRKTRAECHDTLWSPRPVMRPPREVPLCVTVDDRGVRLRVRTRLHVRRPRLRPFLRRTRSGKSVTVYRFSSYEWLGPH